MNKETIIEQILQTLERQAFADSYMGGGIIERWITGELPKPTKEEVKQEIVKLFYLN